MRFVDHKLSEQELRGSGFVRSDDGIESANVGMLAAGTLVAVASVLHARRSLKVRRRLTYERVSQQDAADEHVQQRAVWNPLSLVVRVLIGFRRTFREVSSRAEHDAGSRES